MTELDEHLERQISRALDGELSADERAALDRELLRDSAARRLMERSEQLDALAGEALRSLCSEQPSLTVALSEMFQRPQGRGYPRAWWLLPAAVAAAILAMVSVFSPVSRRGSSPTGPHETTWVDGGQLPRAQPPSVLTAPRRAMPNGGMIPVGQRPTWTDRAIDRGVYGVRGSDGNIYLIEIHRTRTLEQPGTQSRVYPAGGDL
ncbi:MAG: hypothetical protein V2A79_16840 [Planctomycetota bacterium]